MSSPFAGRERARRVAPRSLVALTVAAAASFASACDDTQAGALPFSGAPVPVDHACATAPNVATVLVDPGALSAFAVAPDRVYFSSGVGVEALAASTPAQPQTFLAPLQVHDLALALAADTSARRLFVVASDDSGAAATVRAVLDDGTAQDLGRTPTTSLAGGAAGVFWMENGSLRRADLKTMTTHEMGSVDEALTVTAMAVGREGAYLAASSDDRATSTVQVFPVEVGPPATLVDSVPTVSALALDEAQVYLATTAGILTASFDGTRSTLADLQATAVAVDGRSVYAIVGGNVLRVDKVTGSTATLATGADPKWIGVDGGNVYWLTAPTPPPSTVPQSIVTACK